MVAGDFNHDVILPLYRGTRMTDTQVRITDNERRFQMARRQAIIIELGAIEDYLGLERSIVPRRKREPTREAKAPEQLRQTFDRLTAKRDVN